MSGLTISLLVIALLFVLFLLGFEIGFSMVLAGFIGYAAAVDIPAAFNLVGLTLYGVFSSYGFVVLPLFILMGQLAAGSGISKSLYDCTHRFVGHIPGGLAIGTIAAATAFKAMTGSVFATTATFATVAVPEMDRYGYDKRLSCGTVATVGTLGNIIPPSVYLILYGMITETSIGRLFLAGFIPGLMLAFSFAVTPYAWCKINPEIGPRGEKSTWRERFASLPPVVWVLAIFLVVVGGLMMGFFTPTEAGAAGAFAVLLLVLARRDINLKGFIKSVESTVGIACMVLVMVAGATILGQFFAVTKMPYLLGNWLGSFPVPRNVIIIMICAIYLVGGSVIDDLAFFLLVTPVFLPVILRLGYDPIWFGVITAVTLMIGTILPPIAMNVFVASGITKVPVGTIYKGCYRYMVGMSVCLLILLFFPQISLWLPSLIMK